MARKVVWAEPAWDDLAAVADYIARGSEHYAATLVDEVKYAASSLADFAERGQAVSEFGDESIRELLIRPYRLVYKITEDTVIVLTLVHGARRVRRK